MASGPITKWQIDGGKMKNNGRLYFLGSKTTVNGKWSYEIKRHLLLGRKAVTILDNIFKSRDITLLTKVRIVKVMVLSRLWFCQSYGCESWIIKKAECQRIDAFKLWCWRKLLRVLWTARRLNQSIRKEISPEYSLEGLMLKLKIQYFGHLMRRVNSLEKTLMLGKIESNRRSERQWIRWLDGIADSKDMNLSKLWEIVKDREAWHTAVHGVTKSQTHLQTEKQQQYPSMVFWIERGLRCTTSTIIENSICF